MLLTTQDAIDYLRRPGNEPFGDFVRRTIARILEAQRTEIEQRSCDADDSKDEIKRLKSDNELKNQTITHQLSVLNKRNATIDQQKARINELQKRLLVEDRETEMKRLVREIGERQERLHYLVLGDQSKSVTFTWPLDSSSSGMENACEQDEGA